jgi:hypothetical protein
MPGLQPTSSSTPSAISPATSMAFGPEAAMRSGMRRPEAYVSRPGVPSKSTASPASSPRTARKQARISPSVAAFRPMVLAEV